MERRKLLKSSISVATLALAGCAGAARNGQPAETDEIDEEHQTSATIGTVEATFGEWVARESLRYYDSSEDTLAELRPANGWWLLAYVPVRNLGGSGVPRREILQFLHVADGEHPPTRDISPPVDALRPRQDPGVWVEPDSLTEDVYEGELPPGGKEIYTPLYDVPAVEPVLRWEYDGQSRELSPRAGTSP